jgi:hypothetical protein
VLEYDRVNIAQGARYVLYRIYFVLGLVASNANATQKQAAG